MGTCSLFPSFVLPFALYSVLLPILAHQLRLCDVGAKLLIGVGSICVDSSACVRVEEFGECIWFKIDCRMRRVYYVPLAV